MKKNDKEGTAMEQKELLTVIVADDETELREAVCSVIPWKERRERS